MPLCGFVFSTSPDALVPESLSNRCVIPFPQLTTLNKIGLTDRYTVLEPKRPKSLILEPRRLQNAVMEERNIEGG